MNKIVLIGRLTRDPELRALQSGSSVCEFTLAVDRPRRKDGGQEADFIRCVAWGKMGESVGHYMSKGRQVGVSGRLQIRSYETDAGDRRYVTEVVCDQVEFIGNRADGSETAQNGEKNNREGKYTSNGEKREYGQEVSFSDDDLPF